MSNDVSKLVAEGRYQAVAVPMTGEDGSATVRWGVVDETGNRYILVYLKILEGPYAGRVKPWRGFLTEKAGKRTVESFRYMGFKGKKLSELNTQPLDQKVEVEIEHHTYEVENEETGETEERTIDRVSWINQLGGGVMKIKKPMSDDDIRKFSAMMEKSVAKIKEYDGERVTAATDDQPDDNSNDSSGRDDTPPPADDDDLPF